MKNLFWSTRALTTAREDHLTEFLASALQISKPFSSAYANLVFGDNGKSSNGNVPEIQEVKTQVSFPGTTCCPDMILTLSDGRTIACEHKLDALETMGPEQDQRLQLVRYLDLPVDGLLYVRTSWKPPESKVLDDPKYLHPLNREHFLWRDFYPLFSCESNVLLAWLQDGFERLGYTPPHPSIGEMSGNDEVQNQSNRKNFAKLWQRTRSRAHDLGWKVATGSIVELYLSANDSSLASDIFINPAISERFLFRVTPKEGMVQNTLSRLEKTTALLKERTELAQQAVPRKAGKIEVIDITTSLREILGTETTSSEEIDSKLLTFIEPLLETLQVYKPV